MFAAPVSSCLGFAGALQALGRTMGRRLRVWDAPSFQVRAEAPIVTDLSSKRRPNGATSNNFSENIAHQSVETSRTVTILPGN